jgi:transposase InsO family protein
VPAVHAVAEHLPAVSGSSGRLIIYGPRERAADAERTWPGQVFDDPETAYERAMREFVWRSAPRTPLRTPGRTARTQRQAPEEQAHHTLRQQQRALATQRVQALQQRQQEDARWEAVCCERAARLHPDSWTPRQYAAYLAAEDRWLLQQAQRETTLARRQQEDTAWQAELDRLQAPPAPQATKPPWIAILLVTDNCTRQCLGLPLFTAGPKVTAEVVVAALRELLPVQLQFLISDRGTHFTAQQFAQFAADEDFVHVLIARHRPQSNGIAERFVQTLKAWLADHAWSGTDVLETLLEQFRTVYNDRPHQGLALPGLSPNEFAARFWLL